MKLSICGFDPAARKHPRRQIRPLRCGVTPYGLLSWGLNLRKVTLRNRTIDFNRLWLVRRILRLEQFSKPPLFRWRQHITSLIASSRHAALSPRSAEKGKRATEKHQCRQKPKQDRPGRN